MAFYVIFEKGFHENETQNAEYTENEENLKELKESIREAVDYFIAEFGHPGCDWNLVLEEILGVFKNIAVIDRYISDSSHDWDITRINKVDLAILRLAVFEILFAPNVPASIAINEAVEITKKFSSPQAASFINGILGSVEKSFSKNPDTENPNKDATEEKRNPDTDTDTERGLAVNVADTENPNKD